MRLEIVSFHAYTYVLHQVVSAIYMSTYFPLKFVQCTINQKLPLVHNENIGMQCNEHVTKFARNSPKPMQRAGLGTAPGPAARLVSINIVTMKSTFVSSCAASWQACAHGRSIMPVGLDIE